MLKIRVRIRIVVVQQYTISINSVVRCTRSGMGFDRDNGDDTAVEKFVVYASTSYLYVCMKSEQKKLTIPSENILVGSFYIVTFGLTKNVSRACVHYMSGLN